MSVHPEPPLLPRQNDREVGLPVGAGVGRWVVGALLLPLAVGLHRVNRIVSVSEASERYLLAVGRVGRGEVALRALGAIFLPSSVGLHRIDLFVVVPVAGERYLLTIGRPGGHSVVARALVGEVGRRSVAVSLHHQDPLVAV